MVPCRPTISLTPNSMFRVKATAARKGTKSEAAPKKDELRPEDASKSQEPMTLTAVVKKEEEVADDRNTEETVQDEDGPTREPMEEAAADDTKPGGVFQTFEGASRAYKAPTAEGKVKNSDSVTSSNSLLCDDDGALTVVSSITKGSCRTKYQSIGSRWLDFIESRVIPSPFCRAVACGGVDDESTSTSKYEPTKYELRVPGFGRCNITIE